MKSDMPPEVIAWLNSLADDAPPKSPLFSIALPLACGPKAPHASIILTAMNSPIRATRLPVNRRPKLPPGSIHSHLTTMGGERITWLNSIRNNLTSLYNLASALEGESDEVTGTLAKFFICETLADLQKLFEVFLPPILIGPEGMISLAKVKKLVDGIPWPQDPETGESITELFDDESFTPELQEYAASIDPRYLDTMLRLLSNVPFQVQATATPGPADRGNCPVPKA